MSSFFRDVVLSSLQCDGDDVNEEGEDWVVEVEEEVVVVVVEVMELRFSTHEPPVASGIPLLSLASVSVVGEVFSCAS